MSNDNGLSTTPAILNDSFYNSSEASASLSPITVTLNSLSSLICVLGFIGNIIIGIVILKRKTMRTPTNWFVFNLAICDLCIVIITIPYYVLDQFIDWPFGELGCEYLIMPTMEVFAGVCVLTHTAISFARYAIISKIEIRVFSGLKIVKLIIGVIWCVSYVVLSVTIMGEFDLYENMNGRLVCGLIKWSSDTKRKAYRVCVFILTYVIPMVFTGYSYYKIHNIVGKSFHHVVGFLPYDMLLSRRRKKRQMDRMLTVMYSMFAVTTLPIQLFMLLYDFDVIDIYEGIQNTYGLLLNIFYLQILTNPFILLYMGDEYRKEISKFWIYCCMSRKKDRILLESSVRTTCTEVNKDGSPLRRRKQGQYDLMVSATGNVSLYSDKQGIDSQGVGYNSLYFTPALDEIWQHKKERNNDRSGSVPCTEYTDIFMDDDQSSLDGRSSFSRRRSSGRRHNSYGRIIHGQNYVDGYADDEQSLIDHRISNLSRRRSSGKSNRSFRKFSGLEYKDVYTDEELAILDEQVSNFSRRRSSDRRNKILALNSEYAKRRGSDYRLGDKMVCTKTKLIGNEPNKATSTNLIILPDISEDDSLQERHTSDNVLNIDIHINTQVVIGNNKLFSRMVSIDENSRTLYTIPEVRNSTGFERDDASIYITHSNTSSLILMYDPDRETVI